MSTITEAENVNKKYTFNSPRKQCFSFPQDHLLWHTDKLEILHYKERNEDRHLYFEKNRIPKFYRCSIKELDLYISVLSIEDFMLITAEKQIQSFEMHRDSWICYPDYSKVDIAEILKLEVMPKLASLKCHRDATNYTNEILEKLRPKYRNMEVKQIQEYLNIVDDYTPEERKAMEEHPLEFFTGVSIQQDGAVQQQEAQAAAGGQ
uniref:Uncharacterized protein n=1 Tax=Panagrolaimus davidi TaxID=227884 RepID=A0A914Q858_9BILA